MMPTHHAFSFAANASSPVATAWEIPTHGRPDFIDIIKGDGVPAAATAVRTPPSERRTSRPDSMTMYFPDPDPEMSYYARRHAYAYISGPATAPARADPKAFVRRVFRTLALDDLTQGLELRTPSVFGDVIVCFRTPEDREAAMRRQPFELDGATVKLVREGETPNVTFTPIDCLAHVALHRYPVEQRTEEEIRANCMRFGFVLEVDRACLAAAAPDLGTVFVVVNVEHPREIPRELRIRYSDGSRSAVPVEILRVWDRSQSLDANGDHVPIFLPPAAVA